MSQVCSLRHGDLAAPARAARPVAAIVSVVVHVAVLVVVTANLVHSKPAIDPEPEPVLVRLPRALAPPPPAKREAAVKAPEKPKVAKRPLVQPVEVPPEVVVPPEEPVEEEAVAEEVEQETSDPAGRESPPSPAASTGVAGGMVGGTGDDPLTLAQVARVPELVERVTPDYPRDARTDHIEGTVVLRAVIGRDGRIERDQIKVIRSVPALDAAAIAALCGWRFTPAVDHQGRSVRVLIEIPFEFTLT